MKQWMKSLQAAPTQEINSTETVFWANLKSSMKLLLNYLKTLNQQSTRKGKTFLKAASDTSRSNGITSGNY